MRIITQIENMRGWSSPSITYFSTHFESEFYYRRVYGCERDITLRVVLRLKPILEVSYFLLFTFYVFIKMTIY